MTNSLEPLPATGNMQRVCLETTRRSAMDILLIALAMGMGLFLAWQTAETLLLIFAGLLFGALLDAWTRGLGLFMPMRRTWRLALVCILMAVSTIWLLVWSGTSLAAQADSLVHLLGDQTRVLKEQLRSWGLAPPQSSEPPRTLAQLLFLTRVLSSARPIRLLTLRLGCWAT